MLAVLQDAVHKLSLLSVIARDPATQAEQLTRTVGDDISRMLTQQKALEGRFHALIGAQPALCTMANKASLRQNQAELQDVGGALRQATKQLCRVLQDSPNVTANLAMVAGCGQALTLLLSGTMDVLASHGTVQPVIEAVLAAELAEVCVCVRVRVRWLRVGQCCQPASACVHTCTCQTLPACVCHRCLRLTCGSWWRLSAAPRWRSSPCAAT